MIRSPPGSVWSTVRLDARRQDVFVFEVENVRHLIAVDRSSLRTTGAPVMTFPSSDHAVLLSGDGHLSEA